MVDVQQTSVGEPPTDGAPPAASAARRGREWGSAAGAALGLIALAAGLVAVRDHAAPAVICLVLAAAVVFAGQIGGVRAGTAAALAASAGHNFFQTRPYLSLRIHDADDVWTTATLLAVGLMAGAGQALTSTWRRRARRAVDELAAVERAARIVATETDRQVLVDRMTAEVARLLSLDRCTFVPGAGTPDGPFITAEGALGGVAEHVSRGESFALPASGVVIVVSNRGVRLGDLRCVPGGSVGVSLGARRAAVSIADLLGVRLAGGEATSDR